MINALSLVLPRIGGTAAASATQGAGAATATAGAAAAPAGPSFAQVLEDVATNTVDTLRRAESTSISGIGGQASALEVVEAIKAAEQALATATAIRDKAVQAYQEVSRMAN